MTQDESSQQKPFLNTKELAVMLSISGKTLLKLRRRKKIPEPFLAEGRQVLWTRVQIECWIESSVNKESR